MRFSEWDEGSQPGSVSDDAADLIANGLVLKTPKP
jgi:hypothetical protein